MVATKGALSAQTVSIGAVDHASREQMWSLFSRYYCESTRAVFERDLQAKHHVIVLREPTGGIAGFSTLETWLQEVDGKKVAVIYSGDTVVDERYWGQTALQRAFLRYMVRGKLRHPFTPVYWFLISKGYKTYLLLSRNFLVYWPRHDASTPPFEAALLDALARRKFPQRWQPERGVLCHEAESGKLKPEVAPAEAQLLEQHPDVRFFVEKNPGHADGDELCCLGLVHPAQWLAYLAKLARRRLS